MRSHPSFENPPLRKEEPNKTLERPCEIVMLLLFTNHTLPEKAYPTVFSTTSLPPTKLEAQYTLHLTLKSLVEPLWDPF